MFSVSFWNKVRDYANRKCKELYIKKHHCDLKCKRCNTWISETDGPLSYISDEDENSDYMTCKKCKHITKFRYFGPFAIAEE